MPSFTSSYAEQMRADGKFPAALRFESISPNDARGIILHALRKIGQLENIDSERSSLNKLLKGDNDIAERLVKTYEHFKAFNHRSNLAGLRRNRGPKATRDASARGPREPWSQQKKHRGPLREGVLTVHRSWFSADEETPQEQVLEFLDDEGDIVRHDRRKYDEFSKAGIAFLKETFGPMLCYARMDCDEQSGHIHFVLYSHVKEPPSARYLQGRYMMRTSHHECIGGDGAKRGYEIAQDRVGAFFAREEYKHLAIVRGEPRAAKKRQAAKDVAEMLEQQERDAVLGADQKLPSGSPQAKAMYLLKREIENAARKKGSVEKIRKDERQRLKLDYLEIAGLITPDQRHEHQTRRARQLVIDKLEEKHGSVDDVLRDPNRALRDLIQNAQASSDKRTRAVSQREEKISEREQSANVREDALATREQQLDERTEVLVRKEDAFEREKSEFKDWTLSVSKTLISALEDAKSAGSKLSRYLSRIRKFIKKKKSRERLDAMRVEASKAIDDGGFRVREGAPPADTLARMDSLSNKQLRSRLKASETFAWAWRDSVGRADFHRGVLALKYEGELRGLDFAAKTQDITKAQDPERARRHSDPIEEPPVLTPVVEIVRQHTR